MRGLTPEERAAFGIATPPVTGTEARLEALIAAQVDTAAALRALLTFLAPQPPAPPDAGPVELREPAPTPRKRRG